MCYLLKYSTSEVLSRCGDPYATDLRSALLLSPPAIWLSVDGAEEQQESVSCTGGGRRTRERTRWTP